MSSDEKTREAYTRCLDQAFATYAKWLEPMQEHFSERHPREPEVP